MNYEKTAVVLALMIALVAALAGCGGAQTVYGRDDTDISAKVGDTFIIKLEENATTGYQWSMSVSDEDVVLLDKDDYVADDKSGELVGSGGMRVFTFKALKTGEATIDLVYERLWEPNPDDEKVQFKVTVS